MESLVASVQQEQEEVFEQYRTAMAAYRGAVDALEEMEGPERFGAQLQALQAHLECEHAWYELMKRQPEYGR
jgi:hypothetical protein